MIDHLTSEMLPVYLIEQSFAEMYHFNQSKFNMHGYKESKKRFQI